MKPDWAREKVEKSIIQLQGNKIGLVRPDDVVRLLKAERARAQRVVRQLTRWQPSGSGMTTESHGEYIDRDELLLRLR